MVVLDKWWNCPAVKCPNPSTKDKRLSMLWKSHRFCEQRALVIQQKIILQTVSLHPTKKEKGWSNNVKQMMTPPGFSKQVATSCSCFCSCLWQPQRCAPQISLQERTQHSPEQPPAARTPSASSQTPEPITEPSGVQEPGRFCPSLDGSKGNVCPRASHRAGPTVQSASGLRLFLPNPASSSFYRSQEYPPPQINFMRS